MSSSKVYSVSQLYGRKVKPTDERFGLWLLLENLENNNMVSDIGNINYTEGERLLATNNVLTTITQPFCDNIMLVKVCGSEDCDGKCTLVKKEICGSFNSYIRGKFGLMVSAGHGVKAKLPFRLLSDNLLANGAREVIGEDIQRITSKYKDPVCIPYKVELADVKLDSLLELLPDLLEELRKEDYYLMDLDITQDFAGIFNKEEMVNYLTSNFNFCTQGEYQENSNVIVNNDKTVGIDCLTWLTSNARVKIYNKFVCQVTSPGVNKSIGNHIIDFLNCPDTRLKETFSSTLAKEHGITRLEATIYNYSIGNSHNTSFSPLDDCITLLENSKTYFQDAPIYSVSIAKMWTKIADILQNSCCLVFNNMLQYVYWGNKNTRKLTGLQINLPDDQVARKKIINYSLSAFSFNCLPINYIEVVEDTENQDNVRIEQKCYIKAGDTYFSRSRTPFSTIPEDIDIQDAGLVSTSNIIPRVLRKRTNITNRLSPYPIKEINPLSTAYITSTRKRKLELEDIEAKKRKIDYLEKTFAVKEEYKQLLEKEEKIKQLRDRLEVYFNKHWKNLDQTGDYKVSAFTVNNKGKYPYVGILAEKNGKKDVYYVKGWHKSIFISINNRKEELIKDGYVIIPYNGMEIISLPTEEPFFEFITNGVSTYNRNSFAKIEKLKFYTAAWKNIPFTQEDMDQISNITMQEIKDKIKLKDCHRLEEIAEGTELVITGIKEVINREKIRNVLQLENINMFYCSNYWLERELADMDLNYRIKIKLDTLKHTPNRNKERLIFCV